MEWRALYKKFFKSDLVRIRDIEKGVGLMLLIDIFVIESIEECDMVSRKLLFWERFIILKKKVKCCEKVFFFIYNNNYLIFLY